LDLKGGGKSYGGENCMMLNCIDCIAHRILLGGLKQGGVGERDRRLPWEKVEVFTGFWFGGLKLRDHWEDLGVGGRITLRRTLWRQGWMGPNGFSWLRIGSNGGPLWTR